MDSFYDTLYAKAGEMFAILAPIAFVLIVLSLWTGISGSGKSATAYLKTIARSAVLVVVVSQLITWTGLIEDGVESLVYGTLNADPSAVYERYKTMTADQSSGDSKGFWYTMFHLSEKELFKAVIAAVLWTAQFIAKITVFIAYVIYKVALAFAIAIAPLFLGFLATRSLMPIGVGYLLRTVGILLWPLGWGFASMVTDAFLNVMANADFVKATGMEEMKNLLATAAAGLWIIFSTIAAPVIIQRAISTGANIGTALMGGGLAAMKSAMQAGSAAGAALAATGAGAPVALAGAAGAGAAAFGSSSLSGSSASGAGYFVSNLARLGSAGSSNDSVGSNGNSGGSSTDRSSRTSASSSDEQSAAPEYNAADPTNDRQVASLVDRSRSDNERAS